MFAKKDKTPEVPTNWRPSAIAGLVVIVATFGVAGGWSAFAKIDQAVVATAVVSVESSRKVIQHFEGGIVREIFVKDGQQVKEGELLLRLQETQAQASADVLRAQLRTLLAVESRLQAERELKETIEWPAELLASKDKPEVTQLMADQMSQFQDRRASLLGQLSVLEARIGQLQTEISGIKSDRESMRNQIKYIDEELVGLRELYTENLVTMTRLNAMERERSRLDGQIGRSITDEAKAEGQVNELKLQVQQLKQKFYEEVVGQLAESRQKINELREKITVAKDILSRVDISAPRSGTVQNLKVFTLGQVIRSAEPLMEIVPESDQLVVHAQFSPQDIDSVRPEQEVEIRFPAFHSSTLPVMIGRLETVSPDRLIDEQTKLPYFLGVVMVEASQIPEAYKTRLRPGMPAEVIAASGERTVLNYMISPLASRLRKSFLER